MKTSLPLFALSAILSTAAVVSLGTACVNNAKDDGDAGTSSGGTSGSSGTSGTPDGDGGSSGTSGGTSSGGTSSGGTSSGGTSSGAPITSCTTATLWAGNPLYEAANPSVRPTDGTAILADPPFQWGSLSFIDDRLYTRDTGEIWYVDLGANPLVEKHLLGANQGNEVALKFGACGTARVGAIQGIVALKDGSLVAPDAFGNDILHVKNPNDAATCAVESWAGLTADTTFSGQDYPNLGDVDGPVGTSKIGYPTAIATDGDDNIFFYDGQAEKFKYVANDANHTVKTIAKMPDDLDICYGMVNIGSTIYALGYGANGVTNIYKVGQTSLTKVTGGNGDFWGLGPSSAQLGGLTTDGTNLFVAGRGYVWLVKISDGSIKVIAGNGQYQDVAADAKDAHPALEVGLVPWAPASAASIGSPDFLGFKDGALYYRGHGDSTASYVEKIQCQ